MPCACLPVQSRIAEKVRGADFSIHREKKTYISSVNHSVTSCLFDVPTVEFPGLVSPRNQIAAVVEREDFENEH